MMVNRNKRRCVLVPEWAIINGNKHSQLNLGLGGNILSCLNGRGIAIRKAIPLSDKNSFNINRNTMWFIYTSVSFFFNFIVVTSVMCLHTLKHGDDWKNSQLYWWEHRQNSSHSRFWWIFFQHHQKQWQIHKYIGCCPGDQSHSQELVPPCRGMKDSCDGLASFDIFSISLWGVPTT